MATTSGATRTSSSVGTHTMERFPPGTIVSVGTHRVEIVNYLAEGGFAQIYVVKFIEYLNEFDNKLKNPLKVGEVACLKRVLVQDENGLSEMRNEVEVMKQLMGAKNIVQYYDSNACRRHNGNSGFEVLLLMELCPNKSLLDYMNQRLATKLTEKEILKIMYDVSLAVAQMHYLQIPLIHRDIKIENVLVDADNNFKLCDFGSTSNCFPVVTTHQEIAILTQNIYVHTTPQYRCPEMIDLYRCLPINEKSDIWALGIFLYKLLFFTTPFEMTGQFAILHSKYEFPPNKYSSQLINLVIIMLAENPYVRPNIYQVLTQICTTMAVDVPIEDKYGAGAYDFKKYAEFQTKLQDTQYQMYVLQQKRLENGYLNPSEESMLNNLMIAAFEVSAKIPMEADSRGSSNTPELPPEIAPERTASSNEDLIERKSSSLSEEAPTRGGSLKTVEKQTDREMNNAVGIDQERSVFETAAQKSSIGVGTQSINANYAAQHAQHGQQFTATTLDQRQKSTSSISSVGNAYVGGPQALSLEDVAESAPRSDVVSNIKQHKSNNPFPRMAQDYGGSPNTEDFFGSEVSVTPQPNQPNLQQPQYPVAEALYGSQKDGMQQQQQQQQQQQKQQQQRPPYVTQPPQQIRQQNIQGQPNGFIYRPADIVLTAQQKQQQQQPQPKPQPYRQAQEIAGMVNSSIRYNYHNIPPNANIPYYAVQNPQPGTFTVPPHHDSKPRPMGPSQSQQHPIPAHADQGISHQVQNMAQDENPPPMPARHEKATTENPDLASQTRRKEEELLIAFSPPKQQVHVHQEPITNEDSPTKLQKQPSKHGSLDLSYNEMDLSQEDLTKADTECSALRTGGMDSSMASSESIELNLDEAKLGVRSLRINRTDPPTRSIESPIGGRRDFRKEEKAALENESESEKEIPTRRSLDLQYHEIHFSSPDLNSENIAGHKGHQKPAGPTKQRPNRPTNKKISEPSDSGSHLSSHAARRSRGSANSSSTTSRKHSSNHGNAGKTPSQIRSDLERYKAKSSSGSNSSINISSTNISGMRRSFAKARQSLDLEKVRREALNSSEPSLNTATAGKRRSLFSVFRGDKK